MSKLQEIQIDTIGGEPTTLGAYAGKVLLVVNVASKCGLTPQYTALEALYRGYRDRGLVVLGFPANDFGAQEPGTNAQIAEFCSLNYSVDFPLFAKIGVVGADKHPLYAELTAAAPTAQGDKDAFRQRLRGFGLTPTEDPEVLWNFEKFVVARDGRVIARFAPSVTPDDPTLVAVIERELGAA